MQDNQQLITMIAERLVKQGQQITCIESCTGGGLAAAFTELAGSSVWFEQGYVTYSNQAKQQMIGVSPQTLAQYGAVSQQVASEMAEKGRLQAKAAIAVAITGIAGPAGGSEQTPVGTVFLAFATAQATHVYKKIFAGERQQVRQQAINFALITLVDEILIN